jgi:hypothetical protein
MYRLGRRRKKEFDASKPHAHYATIEQECQLCDAQLQRCSCVRDDEPNRYCGQCQGSGFILKEKK